MDTQQPVDIPAALYGKYGFMIHAFIMDAEAVQKIIHRHFLRKPSFR